MKKHIETLHSLLEKYMLRKPAQGDLQSRIMATRKSSLVSLLKKENKYNMITGLALHLNLFLRNRGIRISHKKSSFLVITAPLAAACIIVVSVFTLHDYRQPGPIAPGENSFVILTSGSPLIERRAEPARQLLLMDEILAGDNFKTGIDSMIIFQQGETAVTGIMKNSSVHVKSLIKSRISNIRLSAGTLLSHVSRLKKGKNYIISTPNAVVTVKGTEFSVSYLKKTTIVVLGSGKVMIRYNNGNDEKIIEEGKTATITDRIILRPATERELKKLSIISLFPVERNFKTEAIENILQSEKSYRKRIDEIEKSMIEEKLKSSGKNNIINDVKEKTEMKELPPLEKLRKEGKILTMLHLKDGSKIAGAIVSQNENELKLDTGDGIITILKQNIIRRIPFK